ncbi:DUF1178 family protein [Pigmentiphaga sp.]|uniref:DUF1178 family protein n=1 Tax=Pigmentiphaga sp. TaxID=1977564 RepID=UPI00128D7599|nr:DUF1178 family protein [Pigmentiphaga sp.]MPS26695.1 DUF1178 family protein [Alcaligenaceae bacterium SAGV5]MPS53714.1 DUF1178 family protein [Alcaligenaceae bacterium SAGV3]MPT57854.1 DUF1178 family protein [Alcaligenaceae bacterium]
MAFKVFDLQCEHGHVFEGWFSSHADFDTQRERGLISCPLCDSKSIDKKLSAPMLNVSGSKAPAAPASREPGKAPMSPDMQAAMLQQLREALRQTENVGERFATEARRIHHGDAPERPIRGVATQEERRSLTEEGIAVAPIPALLDDDRLQ